MSAARSVRDNLRTMVAHRAMSGERSRQITVAIARKVTVRRAKTKAIARVAIGHTSRAKIKVIARVVIGHTNRAKIRVSVKDHPAAIGHTSRAKIKVIAPIALKAIVGHARRATHNSSLGYHVVKVNARWHHLVAMALLMTSTRCHRRRRPGVRRAIKTPCGADGGG